MLPVPADAIDQSNQTLEMTQSSEKTLRKNFTHAQTGTLVQVQLSPPTLLPELGTPAFLSPQLAEYWGTGAELFEEREEWGGDWMRRAC